MGWPSWLGGKDSDTKAPDRQDRQKCWESRDSYFSCLDASGILKPGDEGTACSKPLKDYEKNCARSWIEYFNQRRILAEQQKESLAMVQSQAEDARRKAKSR